MNGSVAAVVYEQDEGTLVLAFGLEVGCCGWRYCLVSRAWFVINNPLFNDSVVVDRAANRF